MSSKRYTSQRDLAIMFLRQGGKCAVKGCDVKLAKVNNRANYIIEHRQPLSRGGTDTLDNKECRCIPHATEKTYHPRSLATTLGGDNFEFHKTNRIARGGKTIKNPMKAAPEGYEHRWGNRGFAKKPDGYKHSFGKRRDGK